MRHWKRAPDKGVWGEYEKPCHQYRAGGLSVRRAASLDPERRRLSGSWVLTSESDPRMQVGSFYYLKDAKHFGDLMLDHGVSFEGECLRLGISSWRLHHLPYHNAVGSIGWNNSYRTALRWLRDATCVHELLKQNLDRRQMGEFLNWDGGIPPDRFAEVIRDLKRRNCKFPVDLAHPTPTYDFKFDVVGYVFGGLSCKLESPITGREMWVDLRELPNNHEALKRAAQQFYLSCHRSAPEGWEWWGLTCGHPWLVHKGQDRSWFPDRNIPGLGYLHKGGGPVNRSNGERVTYRAPQTGLPGLPGWTA